MGGHSILTILSIWTLLAVWSTWSTQAAVVHLYVSPAGSDSNTGLQPTQPVKTLQHAVDMLRNSGIAGNTVFLELMEGYYDQTSTLHFQTPVNGTAVFRAYQGQEVHVTGGKRIASSLFHPVTDSSIQQRLPQSARAKVLEVDLDAAGIQDLGNLTSYGFGHNWNAPLEIFINGKPLILAEWPNRNFINILSVPDGEQGRRFTYNSGGRDAAWALETEPWVYGWWYWSWADSSLPVSHIDPVTHTITLATNSQYGVRVGHYRSSLPQAGYSEQGGYFRVINMLSELDEPGEYFIDRAHRKLYLWPNTPQQTLTSSDIVYGSMLRHCIRIEGNVHNVQFEDFTLENCRQYGVDIANGRDLTFRNMEFRNTGSFAISCGSDCRRFSVLASEFHDVGAGVHVEGGNRTDLTSSEIMLRDNHLWEFSRCGAVPGYAFHINGVHVTVSHNHIHHGQYTAIWWTGNNHVMENNHIHHMCWNSSDCGAIHSGRDWTWRGNIIRSNHIHHTLRFFPGADVRGIMLDDEYSSVLIERNVFYENEIHANIGGGRDNVIRYNVFYNATKASIQVDGRGLGSGGHSVYLTGKLEASPYQTPLWQSTYPELASILAGHPEAPEGNQIYSNVFFNPSGIERVQYSGSNIDKPEYFDVYDNVRSYSNADFRSPDNADFRLRCNVAQWASSTHFPEVVTLSEVGPQVPTGPNYLQAQRQAPPVQATTAPPACDSSTNAPATTTPRGSYLPDGSSPNTLYPNISREGCWFVIDHCPNHPEAEGTHRDTIGSNTGTEEGCLARAGPQWNWCGSSHSGQVVAIYGPTGAMTVGGDGCFFADYGCTTEAAGSIHRDTWAEQNQNAANDEQACLSRAAPQWQYCGAPPDRPITSIYRPTGNFRTAGTGCWIKIVSCPADHTLESFFYDAWGATNVDSDHDRAECFYRAEYFWIQCGSHDNAPVTAFYRPSAANHTVP